MSDSDLRDRLISGDEQAFAELYGKLNPSLLRVATALTGSRATAEEVAQETWLAVINGIDNFEGRASLKNWIFRILTNKSRTRASRDGRFSQLADGDAPANSDGDGFSDQFTATGSWAPAPALWDEITPERTLAGREVWKIVTDAIDSLPPVQQAILGMCQAEKSSASEIACLLDLTEGNVRVHLHRARDRIRTILDQKMAS